MVVRSKRLHSWRKLKIGMGRQWKHLEAPNSNIQPYSSPFSCTKYPFLIQYKRSFSRFIPHVTSWQISNSHLVLFLACVSSPSLVRFQHFKEVYIRIFREISERVALSLQVTCYIRGSDIFMFLQICKRITSISCDLRRIDWMFLCGPIYDFEWKKGI